MFPKISLSFSATLECFVVVCMHIREVLAVNGCIVNRGSHNCYSCDVRRPVITAREHGILLLIGIDFISTKAVRGQVRS